MAISRTYITYPGFPIEGMPTDPEKKLSFVRSALLHVWNKICEGTPLSFTFSATKEEVISIKSDTWPHMVGQFETLITSVCESLGNTSGLRVHLEQVHDTVRHQDIALLRLIEHIQSFLASPDITPVALPLTSEVKLVLLDLNGVLCKKTKKRKVPGALSLPSYSIVPRPGHAEFVDKLILAGYKVGVYSSTTERNASQIIDFLGIKKKLDFAWYNNHCVRAPDLGPYGTRKSLQMVVDSPSVNLEDDGSQRFQLTEIIICDDSPEKIEMNPEVCQFVVPSFADEVPEVPLTDVYEMLMGKIRKRRIVKPTPPVQPTPVPTPTPPVEVKPAPRVITLSKAPAPSAPPAPAPSVDDDEYV